MMPTKEQLEEKIARKFLERFAMSPESPLHDVVGTDLKRICDFFFGEFSTIRESDRAEMVKEAEEIKRKWTRPSLDNVVGQETAEVVGAIGERIADEFIKVLVITKE